MLPLVDELSRHVLAETVELMHALVKHRHDSDRAIGQQPPIDVMMLAAAEESIHAKFSRDSAPRNLASRDLVEFFEQVAYITSSLVVTPSASRVDIDIVETTARPILNTKSGHAVNAWRYER